MEKEKNETDSKPLTSIENTPLARSITIAGNLGADYVNQLAINDERNAKKKKKKVNLQIVDF